MPQTFAPSEISGLSDLELRITGTNGTLSVSRAKVELRDMSGRLVQSTSGLAGPSVAYALREVADSLLDLRPSREDFPGSCSSGPSLGRGCGARPAGQRVSVSIAGPVLGVLKTTSARHRFNRAHSEHSPCKPDIAFKHCTDMHRPGHGHQGNRQLRSSRCWREQKIAPHNATVGHKSEGIEHQQRAFFCSCCCW